MYRLLSTSISKCSQTEWSVITLAGTGASSGLFLWNHHPALLPTHHLTPHNCHCTLVRICAHQWWRILPKVTCNTFCKLKSIAGSISYIMQYIYKHTQFCDLDHTFDYDVSINSIKYRYRKVEKGDLASKKRMFYPMQLRKIHWLESIVVSNYRGRD